MSDPAGRLVLITGLSGSGMSTALKLLEDLGYEAVDNLPLGLIPTLIANRDDRARPLALTIDARSRSFSAAGAKRLLDRLRAAADIDVTLIYLHADLDILQRRYTETRRRHPLATDRPVEDGIQRERQMVIPLREVADLVLDTSQLTQHDLRRWLDGHFGGGDRSSLAVTAMSFAFRRGLPREADLVFDVRFLSNPHWQDDLRPLTGRDGPVQRHIDGDEDFGPFVEHLQGLLGPLLPRYHREGKSYLTIAIGCTGGRHRSVYVAELLGAWVAGLGFRAAVRHRELDDTAHLGGRDMNGQAGGEAPKPDGGTGA